MQGRVPISVLPVLSIFSLSTQGVPIMIAAKEVYLKGPVCVLKTAKLLSVQRCTLCVLNGSHLSYVAEEAEPGGARLSRDQRMSNEFTCMAGDAAAQLMSFPTGI